MERHWHTGLVLDTEKIHLRILYFVVHTFTNTLEIIYLCADSSYVDQRCI